MDASTTLVVLVLAVPLAVALAPRLFPQARISLWLLGGTVGRRQRRTDVERAAQYHRQLPSAERQHALDDRTWRDLDLDDVFVSVDHTESEVGRQVLYHLLRSPHRDGQALERLEQAVRALSSDESKANTIRAALRRLDDPRAGQLANLFFGDLPPRPTFWWVFPLLTAGSIACLMLLTVWPRALLVWIGICAVNIALQVYNRTRVQRFVPALHEVPNLVRVAGTLAAMDLPAFAAETSVLREGANRLRAVRLATRWLMFEPGQADPVVASVYEYVNLFFLFDVNAFVFALGSLQAVRGHMRRTFEAIGYIDAALSIATWRRTLAQWTTPDLTARAKTLDATDVRHPLIADAVANSLEVDGAGILITGSNMSGKTTFVRTIGVNAVLAQTLHTVCAAGWRAPFLSVRTSIGRSDSLVEGKSYYLAEVESVRGLLRAKGGEHQHLFLLDEIFRGTNTTERIAAGFAVLSYLNRGADIVFVASHDIEVIDLLGDAYASYHFREDVVNGAVTFDYRLRPGPASTRNAIALLELMDYPGDVVAAAIAVLDWREKAVTRLTR